MTKEQELPVVRKLALLRFTIGRTLIIAGLHAMPRGKVRDELTALFAAWSNRVRAALTKARASEWSHILEDGSCDHEWSKGDAWPTCIHCEQPAPDDYADWFDQ